MAEIINLRLARKARARTRAAADAASNRAVHGRTKSEKSRDADAADRLARHLAGARRDGADESVD